MFEKLQGIVLNVMKYSDKNSIAHVYTNKRGRMAFLLPQGGTKGARMRNAAFMPLSIVEFEARIMPGKDLCSLRDVRLVAPLTQVYCDPVRSAVAMFVSEFLSHVIMETERNESLFRFIAQSIIVLNTVESGVANFHICFMYNLGAFLGIQPDEESYKEGAWFNLDEGVFSLLEPSTSRKLRPAEAKVLYNLSRMTYANMHLFRFNRAQRGEVLDIMLSYYKIHMSSVGNLRSPEILKQLFD